MIKQYPNLMRSNEISNTLHLKYKRLFANYLKISLLFFPLSRTMFDKCCINQRNA